MSMSQEEIEALMNGLEVPEEDNTSDETAVEEDILDNEAQSMDNEDIQDKESQSMSEDDIAKLLSQTDDEDADESDY